MNVFKTKFRKYKIIKKKKRKLKKSLKKLYFQARVFLIDF